MFFTLIISAYNCQKTIDRLLISVVNQHYDDLKVIVIDDSDKNRRCQKYINKYQNKLNIEYYIRRNDLYTCHCPGNTRHDGLRRALEEDTEYIFFADCDDEFFPNVLNKIYKFLIKSNYPNILITPFQQYFEKEKKIIEPFSIESCWLHGKFYKKFFLLKNNIQFKIDLYTYEDIFFNGLVSNYSINDDYFLIYKKKIYKWYNREDSTSHLIHPEKHFKSWLIAVFFPIFQGYTLHPQQYQFFIELIIHGLTTGYFFIQEFIYYNYDNKKLHQKNYQLYKKILIKIINNFYLSKQKIILLIYQNSQLYWSNRIKVENKLGFFIEEQSFKDFINNIKI